MNVLKVETGIVSWEKVVTVQADRWTRIKSIPWWAFWRDKWFYDPVIFQACGDCTVWRRWPSGERFNTATEMAIADAVRGYEFAKAKARHDKASGRD